MKYRYIQYSFLAALLLGLVVRYKQLFDVTEVVTGFFYVGKEKAGWFYGALLLLLLIGFSVCASLVNRCPLKTPKVSKALGTVSMVSGAFVLIEAITYITQVSMFSWEKLLLGVTGPATAIFLVLYGLKGFKNYPLPRVICAVPILYYLSRFICEFISVSKTALIFQNILNLAAIASVLVFMLEWGKIANNVSGKLSYKIILISGGVAALLCEITAIPELIFLISNKNAVPHQNPVSLVNLAIMGAFIGFYLYRHFKSSNLERKRHIRKARTMKDTDGTNYYVGDAAEERSI
jgi:hypothetical protein